MSLPAPRVVFGIHEATFYNPTTKIPYGTVRVLGNGTFSMSGNTIELRGGSNRFPWSIQDGNIDAKLDMTLKEYPDFMMELFLGKKPTVVASSATGSVDNFIDGFGGSLKDAVNGISAIGVSTANKANLKFGKYVLKAVDSTHVNIYALTNVDFSNGAVVDFVDETLLVNSAPISCVAGAVVVADLGLELTVIGTPAFIAGHTASFSVAPIHAGQSSAIVGGLSDIFPEFGCLLTTQQLGSGEMFTVDIFKAKAVGMNLGASEKAFSETPISAKAYYDSSKGGICEIVAIKKV